MRTPTFTATGQSVPMAVSQRLHIMPPAAAIWLFTASVCLLHQDVHGMCRQEPTAAGGSCGLPYELSNFQGETVLAVTVLHSAAIMLYVCLHSKYKPMLSAKRTELKLTDACHTLLDTASCHCVHCVKLD